MQYSEMRNYGFNIILKQYANFPGYLPLPCHAEHGWTPLPNALISDLKSDKPVMMVFSKRREEAWKKSSKTPVVIMGAPFIHYKNMQKIRKKPGANGTVVFPSHSTFDLKVKYIIDDYCRELKKLPKEFQPVTICLFWLDYIDEKANIYRKHGFKVVSAGPKLGNSLCFPRNFYDILSDHKYASSNEVGTCAFYAVDLGLPFFLTGEKPVMKNEKLRDVNIGKESIIDETEWGRKSMAMFSTGPVLEISTEQKKFVDEEMGIDDCISSTEMHDLFWKTFRKKSYWVRAVIPYIFLSVMRRIIFDGPWGSLLIYIRKKLA